MRRRGDRARTLVHDHDVMKGGAEVTHLAMRAVSSFARTSTAPAVVN
jgi:hypothetical protein